METAVLLCVPEADGLVGPWRDKGDPSASAGVPAHVTLLYPFLDTSLVDEGVVAELDWFFRGVDAFAVRFDAVGEFAAEAVRDGLPLAATAARAALWTCDEDGRWTETHVFELGLAERPD